MTAEVVNLETVTRLDLPAERILQAALAAGLESAIVIGYDADGDEYFASSLADGGAVIWLLERSKLRLLRMADE